MYCAIDADGDVDLIAPNPGGNTVLVIENLGGGSFAVPVAYAVGIDPEGVTCTDFDGINGPDLAVTNEGTFNVSVLMNNGDGTFQRRVMYPISSTPRDIIAADLMGNGHIDLSIKHLVFVPFLAFTFESFLDQVEIIVE